MVIEIPAEALLAHFEAQVIAGGYDGGRLGNAFNNCDNSRPPLGGDLPGHFEWRLIYSFVHCPYLRSFAGDFLPQSSTCRSGADRTAARIGSRPLLSYSAHRSTRAAIRRVLRMSCSGFASKSTRSATLPCSTVPTESAMRKNLAERLVVRSITSAGAMPSSVTNKAISSCIE